MRAPSRRRYGGCHRHPRQPVHRPGQHDTESQEVSKATVICRQSSVGGAVTGEEKGRRDMGEGPFGGALGQEELRQNVSYWLY